MPSYLSIPSSDETAWMVWRDLSGKVSGVGYAIAFEEAADKAAWSA
jgi:hypothetical protein